MTDRWAIPRSCASAAILTDVAAELGVAAEVVLADSGIRAEQLHDPSAEITAGQELRLVQNLVRELGDVPGLGLTAGSRYHASTHGIMGFAIMSSRTVREAIETGVRYFRLSFTFADMLLEPLERDLRLTLDDSETPSDVRAFMGQRDLAAIGSIQIDIFGAPLPLREFSVAGPDPGYPERFEQATGHRPTFGAERTSVLLGADVLDLQLPQANPHAAAMCERQCAELLQRRMARTGVSGAVRELLTRRSTVADQDDVARALSTSVRTLRRQLAEEGTTFRELSAEVNCLLAEELLSAGLPVEQVAHRLGYATASSFTHAYRRWRGTTPGRYARQRRASKTG